jgi:hypothetical protein
MKTGTEMMLDQVAQRTTSSKPLLSRSGWERVHYSDTSAGVSTDLRRQRVSDTAIKWRALDPFTMMVSPDDAREKIAVERYPQPRRTIHSDEFPAPPQYFAFVFRTSSQPSPAGGTLDPCPSYCQIPTRPCRVAQPRLQHPCAP